MGDTGRSLARVEQLIRDHAGATVLAVALVLTLDQLVASSLAGMGLQGLHWRYWDPAAVSAALVFAITLPIALRLPQEADNAIERLVRRRVLVGSGTVLRAQVARAATAWSGLAGLLTASVLFVIIWVWTYHSVLSLFAIAAGFVAGRVIGRALAISGLGRRVERGDWTLRIQPGHVDGAAGLKPVGDLYFRQAMILAIPAIWLGVRLLLPMNDRLRLVYVWLLAVTVMLEVLAFVAPMLSFHRIMSAEKRRLLEEADHSSRDLYELEERLPSISEHGRRTSVSEQIARLRERYVLLEQLPTWPVAPAVRRRFTIRNALLLLPLLLNAVGLSQANSQVFQGLIDAFSSG